MSSRDEYYFGSDLKVIDYYAFPRTGSHLLYYCMTGLFDLVTRMSEEDRKNPEAASRKDELSAEVLYSLELRESGAPFAPVLLNIMKKGLHHPPEPGGNPILMLIRHPLAAAYSAWCTRKRMGFEIETAAQLAIHLDCYEKFYDAALELVQRNDVNALLIRYENLVSSCLALDAVAAFAGVRPKLSAQFVHWVTRFDRFVGHGDRTFYKAGDDKVWRESKEFLELLESAGPARDFRRFGYIAEDKTLADHAGVAN
jgi:hypothetical protein